MLWKAKVDLNGTPNVITNVQQVSVSGGRQALVDNYGSSRCTITCRYPTGYASPISGLVPGATINVLLEDMQFGQITNVFYGYVSDVEVQYGIPYAAGVGNADYLVITCETALAKLARASGNGYGMAAGTVAAQVATATTQSKVTVDSDSTVSVSGATVSGSWADWLNQLAVTIGGRITDDVSVTLYDQRPSGVMTGALSDATSLSASDLRYDSIQFDSLAQNYFTQVTVDPESYATQTVSNIPVGESARNYTVNTYSGSDGQTTDLANFYLSQFGTPSIGISEVGFSLNTLTTQTQCQTILALFAAPSPVALQMNVVFRGTTYTCIIEGFNITATPAEQSVQLYVSDNSLNNFLILNNTNFGRLDYNKLGF